MVLLPASAPSDAVLHSTTALQYSTLVQMDQMNVLVVLRYRIISSEVKTAAILQLLPLLSLLLLFNAVFTLQTNRTMVQFDPGGWGRTRWCWDHLDHTVFPIYKALSAAATFLSPCRRLLCYAVLVPLHFFPFTLFSCTLRHSHTVSALLHIPRYKVPLTPMLHFCVFCFWDIFEKSQFL